MSEAGQTYHAFWASLLPQSNRQTGFSLRSPTRRPYVEFCRVGFCFHYRLEYDTPNARVEFALHRSDGEQIYNSLIRQRKQIDEAFGGSLLSLRDAHSSERSEYRRLTRLQYPPVAGGSAVPYQASVGAAQFPEESWNWCGPATLATTLVEDSFAWPGTNSYSGFTLSYNPYVVSQPSSLATPDELWLAQHGVINGDTYNNGTSFSQMLTMLNNFVGGKGGWYATEWLSGSLASQVADFQGKVVSDIGTGWDIPTGIDIGAGSFNSLPGYPYNHSEILHWVPVTFISSDHNTTYYSDPVYGAPAYSGWSVPAPYEHTSTSNLVWYAMGILW